MKRVPVRAFGSGIVANIQNEHISIIKEIQDFSMMPTNDDGEIRCEAIIQCKAIRQFRRISIFQHVINSL